MSVSGYLSCSSKLACSPAIETLESSLQLSLSTLKDLVVEFETLNVSSENYKTQFLEQKAKCESNCCKGSEALKEIITSKDKIIQLTASALTKLNETKNFNIVKEILKILCGDTTQTVKQSPIRTNVEIKKEQESPVYSPEKDSIDIHLKEESLVEIEGTPTGCTSPIIQSKKLQSTSNSTDFREKKKCPSDWHTPESKVVKLIYPSPRAAKGKNLRLKQTKIQLANIKKSNTIDLTSSPEFSGGIRGVRSESLNGVQTLIKKESIESEDTILPSPTSGPTNFSALYKSSKNSPSKFKPPLSLSKLKSENVPVSIDNNRDAKEIADATNIEESINLLQPKRRNGFKRQSPIKFPFIDRDLTNCDTQNDESLSLLHHVNMLEADQENIGRKSPITSPTKRPLAENINVTNLQEDVHIESSMSLLSREIKPITEDKIKRRVPDPTEPLYKEPTVRKKAEKRALPGWSCDECKHFFAELYKDDPDMLAQKMDECSKHRGKQNPVRPKTPDGFWNPRWDVPLDTEEFNKRNNAV